MNEEMPDPGPLVVDIPKDLPGTGSKAGRPNGKTARRKRLRAMTKEQRQAYAKAWKRRLRASRKQG
jgi:thiamine pyrophosphate-dependent acetolactate synthase large subunit-like protein